MNKIEDKLESKNYVATDHDVELLASAHLANTDAAKRYDVSYLRILVQAVKARFNGVKGRRKISVADSENHSKYLAEVHTRLYAFVLKGITTPEVVDEDGLEVDTRRARAAVRNSRAAFARSSASTLQMFIRSGGDVRGLDVTTVGKSQLRAWAKAQEPEHNAAAEAIQSALKRVEREIADLDPDEARTTIEDAMQRLQGILDGLDKPDAGTITQMVRARPAHTRQPAPSGRAHA